MQSKAMRSNRAMIRADDDAEQSDEKESRHDLGTDR
jgi:hypothetical protein